jgi:hypothetical protein
MNRFLLIAAVALLAGSAARAQTYDTSNPKLRDSSGEAQSVAGAFVHGRITDPAAVHASPEFHPAGAIAALTLLLCGVAVLKGWRRQ